MIGGGDAKQLLDTMYQCREIMDKTNSSQYNLEFYDRTKMKYARHGHSCCVIQNRYIIVSGSRIAVDSAKSRVELYDM